MDPDALVETGDFVGVGGTSGTVREIDDHPWQVCFDALRALRQALTQVGCPAPRQHLAVHQRP